MQTEQKQNQGLGETVYRKTLSSGLKCYIIPKYKHQTKEALVCVGYGAADLRFQQGAKQLQTPEGVAHFLEHKLFEEEWGDVFTAFAAEGAKANAFTDFGKTAYYFSTAKDFESNLNRLLHFVQSPYFTDESAKREQGIIGQEIDMYEDDGDWMAYFNLLEALYHSHPIRHQIAGSRESISEIDADLLYSCYENFYQPQNMAFICVGDVDPERIFTLAEQAFLPSEKPVAKILPTEEPDDIKQPYIEGNLEVAKPLFQVGFKHNPLAEAEDWLKVSFGTKMLLDLLFGESSDFFAQMYDEGLLDAPPDFQFVAGRDFAFTALSGTSEQPQTVQQAVWNCIAKAKEDGLAGPDVERIRKKHMGRFLRGMGSTEAVLMSQTELALRGYDVLDAYEAIRTLSLPELEEQLGRYREDRMALSVIRKK